MPSPALPTREKLGLAGLTFLLFAVTTVAVVRGNHGVALIALMHATIAAQGITKPGEVWKVYGILGVIAALAAAATGLAALAAFAYLGIFG